MSNLAQQYISQSYQSVMNVGTGSGASLNATLQPLTDGYGTVSPISLSTGSVAINGNVYITGSIIPQGSGSFNLGSQTNPFNHGYFSSGSIYMDGNRVMGLTSTTDNLHLIAPSGSQIQLGTNVFFQNPEVTLNPGMILEATGPETGSSLYFNGGKGQIVSEGDLSFLLVSGDTVYNPSASINFSVGNVPSGSIRMYGRDNSLELDYAGNIGLTSVSSSVNLFTNSGSITALNGEYGGGLAIYPGLMELHSNGLDGGLAITSQSVAITANNAAGLLVDFKQGSIDIQAAGDLNLSSSLGTVNSWGTSSFIGNVNVIGGPLKVSGSNSIGTIEVINGGLNSQGDIHTSASLIADAGATIGGATGGQYPTVNVLVNSASFTTDIYGGFQVYDPNTNQTYITAVASSYYTPELVGAMAGGGAFDGSDLTLYFPMDGTLALRKPTHLLNGGSVTGSLNVRDRVTFGSSGNSHVSSSNAGNNLELYANSDVNIVSNGAYVNIYSDNNLVNVTGSIISTGDIIAQGQLKIANASPTLGLYGDINGAGTQFPLMYVPVDSGTDPANVFAGIYIYPTSGSAKEFDFAINSYSSQYPNTPVGMILAGGNNPDSNNVAIAFPNDGSMQVFKDTNFNYNVSVAGHLQSSNSFTQAKMTTGQTVTAGSDVVVNFNNVTINNNGWFDTTSHRFQPTVAGTYDVFAAVQVAVGTGNGQMNMQIRKNGSTFLIIQDEVNKNQNHTLLGNNLVELNGSTDYVDVTFYTSSNSGSQDIQDNNGSYFKAVLL